MELPQESTVLQKFRLSPYAMPSGAKLILLFLFSLFGFAAVVPRTALANQCPWIATAAKPVEEVAEEIERRTGKKPTKTCGTGEDYKICHSCADRLTDAEWNKIRPMLAEPSYRKWHNSWHTDVSKAVSEVRRRGVTTEEAFGESFFYAHRELMRAMNANLAAMGLPCLANRAKLPEREIDKTWPTYNGSKLVAHQERCKDPKAVEKSNFLRSEFAAFNLELTKFQGTVRAEQLKLQNQNLSLSDEFEKTEEFKDKLEAGQKELETRFKERIRAKLGPGSVENVMDNLIVCGDMSKNSDPFTLMQNAIEKTQSFAATKDEYSLGIIGSDINIKWHGSLHMAYMTDVPPKCKDEPDDPTCDNILVPTSSHVNMNFYMIHGVIDEIAETWLKTNGYKTAKVDCNKEPGCYTWKTRFMGRAPNFIRGDGCTLKNSNPSECRDCIRKSGSTGATNQ